MPTFQALSGVRLDARRPRAFTDIPATADCLLLAGDIGDPACPSYAAFLRYHAERFRAIVVVAGEREYWGCGNMMTRTQLLRDVCASVDPPGRVVFLNRGVLRLDDVMVVGCTLWRAAPGVEWVPDDEPRVWTDKDRSFMHRFETAFVRRCLQEARMSSSRVVLLTNGPPSVPDLSRPPVALAVSGRPGIWADSVNDHGCRVHSNPASLNEGRHTVVAIWPQCV